MADGGADTADDLCTESHCRNTSERGSVRVTELQPSQMRYHSLLHAFCCCCCDGVVVAIIVVVVVFVVDSFARKGAQTAAV